MRGVGLAILSLALLGFCLPAAGAVDLSIAASPEDPHVGELVRVNGTVSGISTIAVYLFITGPGLDPRGTPLDNLNIPTGHGIFTTAPVFMNNGTWAYAWDTSAILGTLRPGNYTIHVVSHPIDGLHVMRGEHSTTTVNFQPRKDPTPSAPASPFLPAAAFGIAALLVAGLSGCMRR